MQPSDNDGSMFVRKALGQQLISRDTALAICRLIVADLRGTAVREAQEPFVVEDGGDAWKVRGSSVKDFEPGRPGPTEMSISKVDGSILSYFD